MKERRRILLNRMMTMALLIAGLCSFTASAAERVMVYAASSMTNALQDVAKRYQLQHDVKVVLSFASSSTLARQISQGAPSDIYLSANQKWMDYLVDNRVVELSNTTALLGNQLVLIAPQDSSIDEVLLDANWGVSDALAGSRLAIGDPAHVPVGIYTKQSLESLQLWSKAKSHLAQTNNVRGALALVERGEAPLGVVYATDAQIATGVKVVATFPTESHSPIAYPLALVNPRSDAAQSFYDYLQSEQAAAIFRSYGFEVN
ncbi:molybdate ABC transporter substrate-binding protein [Vibrio paucivorans]